MALHITTTIKDNALTALNSLDQIKLQVARVLTRERTAISTQSERIRTGVHTTLANAVDAHQKFMTVIRTATHYQLREAGQSLEVRYARLISTTEQTLGDADLRMKRATEAVAHRSELLLSERRAAIQKVVNNVVLVATAKVEAAGKDLEGLRSQVGRDSLRLATKAADDLDCDLTAVKLGAVALVEAASREVEANTRIVVGLGPQATLSRGFAIARDAENRPITSREAAVRNAEFVVQFQDGTVPVAVRGSEGGEG